MKISTKILAILLLALLPQLVILLVRFDTLAKANSEGAQTSMQFRNAEQLAQRIGLEITGSVEDLEAIASSLDGATGTLRAGLQSSLMSHMKWSELYIVEKDGNIVESALSRNGNSHIENNVEVEALVDRAFKSPYASVSEISRSLATGKPTYYVAAPLSMSTSTILLGEYSRGRIIELISGSRNRVLALDSFGNEALAQEFTAFDPEVLWAEKTIRTVVPIVGAIGFNRRWSIAVESTLNHPLGTFDTKSLTWLSFIALTTLLGCVVVMRYMRIMVLTPLDRLHHLAQSIGEGDFSVRAKAEGEDEVQGFIRAFNAAISRLQSTYGSAIAQLQHRSAAVIEDEKLLRALVDISPVGLLLVREADDVTVRVNPAASALLNNTPFFDVVFERADGGEISKESLPYAVAKETRRTSMRSDIWINSSHDGKRALFITARRVDDGAALGYIVVTIQDITEFREAEKAKSDFISLASHQLRTPVATINWYAELLLGDESERLTNDQKINVEQIAESSRRLSKLVTALLDTSRAELGTLKHDEGFFDPSQVAVQVLAEIRPLSTKKRVKIHENIDSAVPLVACGSKIGLIIFQNLLSNALRYTPDGGDIWCTTLLDNTRSGFLLIVEDSGIGIPENEKEHIFTRFYRAGNAKEVDATGSGLGLALTRTLIERSGGTIEFKARNGGGTVFTVFMPFSCAI